MAVDVDTEIEAVIGLEVHAQLLTDTKMFCRCSAAYLEGGPNSHTCPVCLGLPGALPVINRKAIEYTIRTALALGCEIPEFSKFDRKNYFYPDLPKGYQISQYDLPLSRNGRLSVEVDGRRVDVGITRVHLEEDTGKLTHMGSIETSSSSLVDLNRCGVPLIEIVSEPDMRTADEAREYMQRLRQLLVWIGVSDGNMEQGSLRCDANVSVRQAGNQELGVKVEVKNMNSFKAVHQALAHEIERQRTALINGETIVQETRGWNEARGVTVSQRSKEYAHDYRYFPEPDLPPLEIARAEVDRIRGELPELPMARAGRLVGDLGLSTYDADLVTTSLGLADYFEAVVEGVGTDNAKEAANWVLGEVSRELNEGLDVLALVPPQALAALVRLKLSGTISNNQAKQLFGHEAFRAAAREIAAPAELDDALGGIVEAQGLRQVSDAGELATWVDAAIEAQPQAAADVRAGNERALGRLVGEVMRLSGNRASGPAVNEMLRKKLKT